MYQGSSQGSQRSGSVHAVGARGEGGNGRGNLNSEGDRDTVWDENGFHIYDTIESPNQTPESQVQSCSFNVQPEIHADLDGRTDFSVFSADENSLLNSRQESPLESESGSQFPESPSQSILEAAIGGSQEEAERNSPENRRVEDPLDQILVQEQKEKHEAMGQGGESNEISGSPLELAAVANERESAQQRKKRRRADRFSPLCREEGIALSELKNSPEGKSDVSGEWEA